VEEIGVSVSIDFSGKVALVTGAAMGMGLEIALALSEAGAQVARGDIDEVALAEHEIGLRVRLEVTDPSSVKAALEEITQGLGPIDILVNNAGTAAKQHGMPFTNQEKSDWEGSLAVNLLGTFVVSREVALQMMERKMGVIVNIASIAGAMGSSTDPGYSASKAGVIALTKTIARDLAPFGIRANSICPGMVLTPFYYRQYEAAKRSDPDAGNLGPEGYFANKAKKVIPLGKGQEPRDIANAVLFLASDLASSITGQSLHVDGGLVMH
jgi:NAD(P)-dependent dehydrogenase (short-subunit alcohol dehydrogenase family)